MCNTRSRTRFFFYYQKGDVNSATPLASSFILAVLVVGRVFSIWEMERHCSKHKTAPNVTSSLLGIYIERTNVVSSLPTAGKEENWKEERRKSSGKIISSGKLREIVLFKNGCWLKSNCKKLSRSFCHVSLCPLDGWCSRRAGRPGQWRHIATGLLSLYTFWKVSPSSSFLSYI